MYPLLPSVINIIDLSKTSTKICHKFGTRVELLSLPPPLPILQRPPPPAAQQTKCSCGDHSHRARLRHTHTDRSCEACQCLLILRTDGEDLTGIARIEIRCQVNEI